MTSTDSVLRRLMGHTHFHAFLAIRQIYESLPATLVFDHLLVQHFVVTNHLIERPCASPILKMYVFPYPFVFESLLDPIYLGFPAIPGNIHAILSFGRLRHIFHQKGWGWADSTHKAHINHLMLSFLSSIPTLEQSIRSYPVGQCIVYY